MDAPDTDAPNSGTPNADLPNADLPDADTPAPGTATTGPTPADATAGPIPPVQTPGGAVSELLERAAATEVATTVVAVANAAFASAAEEADPLTDTAAHEAAHPFAGSPGTAAATGPSHSQEHGHPPGEGARRSYRTPREDQSERSLRALVTTRSTQVSPTAALRAREVAVPTAQELLAAEAALVLVRRHYVPPTALAAGRRRDRTDRRPTGGNQSAGQRGPAESL